MASKHQPIATMSPTKDPPYSSATTSAHKETTTGSDCTLAYMRILTAPLMDPPPTKEVLQSTLLTPWNVRLPVDTSDPITCLHWREQANTALFEKMMDWSDSSPCKVKLQPYFSFAENYKSPFFDPHQDVAHCLKHLLLHQVGSHQFGSTYISLISHETHIFLATAPPFSNEELHNMHISESYYLLRCHYDKVNQQLVFGYHLQKDKSTFHPLHHVLFADEDWRLKTCILLTNTARILNCLIHYAIPLTCSSKRCIVDESYIQKIYNDDTICGIFNATVENMISIYKAIAAVVPHTDRLVSIETGEPGEADDETEGKEPRRVICKFAPIGRSYLPQNAGELLDALVCVAEALVSLHSKGIMHRDIRWANVFHALPPQQPTEQEPVGKFTREWVLFDFEFAAGSPQPAFAAHSLTPGNHAPEMLAPTTGAQGGDDCTHPPARMHTTAVDIWGLGFLLANAHVDVPVSHAADLLQLQDDCLNETPAARPRALECLERLKELQSKPFSRDKDIVFLEGSS